MIILEENNKHRLEKDFLLSNKILPQRRSKEISEIGNKLKKKLWFIRLTKKAI
jgi:hypothetical protein